MLNGIVEKIEEKVSKTNKQYFLLTINNKVFGYWKSLPENLEKGSDVEFSYDSKTVGEKTYDNITEIKVISQKELPQKEESTSGYFTPQQGSYLDERFTNIEELLGVINRKIDALLPEPKFENAG